jgi:hypothetical protein
MHFCYTVFDERFLLCTPVSLEKGRSMKPRSFVSNGLLNYASKKMFAAYFPKKKLQHLSEFGTSFWLMQSKHQMADILSLLAFESFWSIVSSL